MADENPHIKLEPVDKDVIPLKVSDEIIVLQLSLKNTPYKIVEWQLDCEGVSSTIFRGGETIRVEMSSHFANTPITVTAKYRGEKKTTQSEFSTNFTMVSTTQPSQSLWKYSDPFKENVVTRVFNTKQEIKIEDIKWASENYYELIKEEYTKDFIKNGIVVIYLTGMNNQSLDYKIYANNKIIDESRVMVLLNRAIIRYSIPDEFFATKNNVINLNLQFTKNNAGSIFYQINSNPKLYKKLKVYDTSDNSISLAALDITPQVEPFVVGTIMANDSNFKLCKFTKVTFTVIGEKAGSTSLIEVFNNARRYMNEQFEINLEMIEEKEKDDEVVVFNEMTTESEEIKPQARILEYPIIAGSEEREIIIKIKEFETEKCKLKDKHKYEITRNKEKIELEKVDDSNYQYKHQVHYNYGGKFMLFTNLWPSLSRQRSELLIDSCRHSNVRIYEDIYPDVKWGLTFSIGTKTDKNTGKFKLDSSIALSASWDDDNNDLSMSISYPFTNIRQQIMDTIDGKAALEMKEMAIDYADSLTNGGFSTILRVVDNVMRFLSKFEEANDNITGFYGVRNQLDVANGRKVMEVKPVWPKLSFGVSWKAATYKKQIGTLIEGAITGTFIGFTATVDLYCCMEKIPNVGTYIHAVDWILKNIFEVDVKFEIEFKGTISGKGTAGYNTASGSGSQKLSITGKIEISINLEVSQDSSYSATIETEAYGADGSSSIYVKMALRHFKKGESHDTPQDGFYGDITAGLGELEVGIFKKKTTEKGQGGEGSTRSGKGKVPDKKYLFGGKKTLLKEQNFLYSESDKGEKVEYIRVLVW